MGTIFCTQKWVFILRDLIPLSAQEMRGKNGVFIYKNQRMSTFSRTSIQSY